MSRGDSMTVKATERCRWMIASLTLMLSCAGNPCGAGIIQGGETISSGAVVTASSETYGPAVRLVDGLLANGTAAEWLANDGASAYITVDLGRITRLSDLNLLNSLNFSDRGTSNFTVQVSTNGAFAGEQGQPASGVLQAKGLGWQDVPLPSFTNPANNALLVGRYVRMNVLTWMGFGPGLTEVSIKAVPNRGTGALSPTNHPNLIRAQAYTRTPSLQDVAPVSWALRRLTPTSASVEQSFGKSTSGENVWLGATSVLVDHIDNPAGGSEVLFGSGMADLSQGSGTVDLGEEMIVDRFFIRNSANFSDRGIGRFIVRVSNDPAFAERNNTDVMTGQFTAYGQTTNFSLPCPAVARYVRVVASDVLGNGAGLDEVTVYGRTFTAQTIATGTGQIGDSSAYGKIELAAALPMGTNLLAIQVTSDVWSSSTLQAVSIVAAPGTVILIR